MRTMGCIRILEPALALPAEESARAPLITTINDRNLLTQPLSSVAVQTALAARGFPNFSPYSGFPLGNSLQSALYPFPQYWEH